MRYICPKCGEVFTVPPPSGACPLCEATLVIESETHDPQRYGEADGLSSPKRRL